MNLKNDLNIMELCFIFRTILPCLLAGQKLKMSARACLCKDLVTFKPTHMESAQTESINLGGFRATVYDVIADGNCGPRAIMQGLINWSLLVFDCFHVNAHMCVCVCVCVWKSTLAAIGALKCNFCPFKKLWQTDQLADRQTDRPSQKEV